MKKKSKKKKEYYKKWIAQIIEEINLIRQVIIKKYSELEKVENLSKS